jgi:hypothetical protein
MTFDLKEVLYEAVKDISWNFVGILDTEKRLHPIPKNLNFQALFERLVLERLETIKKKYDINVIDNENIRAYPDIVLEGGMIKNQIVALDVKTGRRNKDREGYMTGFTLGSYAGYFRKPDEKRAGCIYPYGKFTNHLDICFIYDWDQTADTLHMVSNLQIIVQEKWRLASKTTGTGTTTAIGSIKEIDRIIKGKGDFKSEEEFLDYWRSY